MKFTRFLIAGALVALMAACSNGGSGESQKAPEAAAPSKPAMQEPAKAPATTSSAAMAPAPTGSAAMTPAPTGSAAKPAEASSSM